MTFKPLCPALVLAIGLAGEAQAAQRIYSYDPDDAATRAYVDNGLTFVVDKGLFGTEVKEVLATQAKATARLDLTSERELGAPLRTLLDEGTGGDLYAIGDDNEGPAMVRSLCPGSSRGWLVIGPVRPREDLTVQALGDDPATGKPRHCATLNFRFRGEWRLPDVDNGAPRSRAPLPSPF